MRTQLLAGVLVLGCAVALIGQGRSTGTWTPTRTPDGQIDLEGVWDFSTITPLERPRRSRRQADLHRCRGRDVRARREPPAEPRSDRSQEGRRSIPSRQRDSLQRVLVRARLEDRRLQADLAHRRSTRRTHSTVDAGGGEAARRAGGRGSRRAARSGARRFAGVAIARRPLHPRLQRRAADDAGRLQQLRSDLPGARTR